MVSRRAGVSVMVLMMGLETGCPTLPGSDAGSGGCGTESGDCPPNPWVAVVAGLYSTCALKADHTLWCWGQTYYANNGPTPVRMLGVWTSLAGDDTSLCALDDRGEVGCWGNIANGPNKPDHEFFLPMRVAPGRTWRSFSVGYDTGCGIAADGSLYCFGGGGPLPDGGRFSSFDHVVQMNVDTDWQAVSANGLSCAIKSDAGLWCWSLGEVPAQLTARAFRGIEVGTFGALCAVDEGGSIWCGQASGLTKWDGATSRWAQVSHNGRSACAVTTTGGLWCSAALDGREVTQINDEGWTSVSVGGHHACAIRNDGGLSCWGSNKYDALGIFSAPPVFERVVAGESWSAVSPGRSDTCATAQNGAVWCWGRNDFAAVDADPEPRLIPTPTSLPVVTNVSVGGDHLCALGATGLSCWGASDEWGQLASSALEGWQSLASGDGFACGLRDGGEVRCWGKNTRGQTGEWGQILERLPTPVVAPPVATLSAGSEHVCAVSAAGELWCWGDNQLGQRGPYSVAAGPARLGLESDWVRVGAGVGAACGLRAGGSLWCWGDDFVPYFGLRDFERGPIQMGTASGWTSVAVLDHFVGGHEVCAIDSSTRLWCFPGGKSAPTQATPPSGWTSVVGSFGHLCGIREGGELWCWGDNDFGQLGNGLRSTPPLSPVIEPQP